MPWWILHQGNAYQYASILIFFYNFLQMILVGKKRKAAMLREYQSFSILLLNMVNESQQIYTPASLHLKYCTSSIYHLQSKPSMFKCLGTPKLLELMRSWTWSNPKCWKSSKQTYAYSTMELNLFKEHKLLCWISSNSLLFQLWNWPYLKSRN